MTDIQAINPMMESRTDEIRARLVTKIMPLVGASESWVTQVPSLTLYCHRAPTPALPVTYEPAVAVVLQGCKQVDLGNTSFIYDKSQFLLTALDLPVTSKVIDASEESPYLCMVLRFNMATVREILAQGVFAQRDVGTAHRAMTTSEVSEELLDAFSRLLDVSGPAEDVAFFGRLIEREIIYRVLRTTEGPRLQAIATTGNPTNRTARAVAWIAENYKKPLRVEDLAEVAGMGISTLHHQFRELTAMSPLQYQKKLRLYAARQHMLVDGLDAASAGYEVGYESASQFNREYSRFFGQSPKRDIRILLSATETHSG